MRALSHLVNRLLLLCFMLFLLASCSQVTLHPLATKKERKARTERTYAKKSRKKVKRPTVIASHQVRSNVVKEALSHLGTRYVYGGKRPGGFDCSGFTSFVLKREGVNVTGSSRDQSRLGKRKSKQQLSPGDLAFFGSKGKVTHVGIVKENTGQKLVVVHSTSSKGVRMDDVNGSDYWRKRFLFGRDVID